MTLKMNKEDIKKSAVYLIIIIILLCIVIFREPSVVVENTGREKVLQDSLLLLHSEINNSHIRQERIQSSFDSMLTLDPKIIYRSHEKIKFIFTTSDPDTLDHIIRSNWKDNPGHK